MKSTQALLAPRLVIALAALAVLVIPMATGHPTPRIAGAEADWDPEYMEPYGIVTRAHGWHQAPGLSGFGELFVCGASNPDCTNQVDTCGFGSSQEGCPTKSPLVYNACAFAWARTTDSLGFTVSSVPVSNGLCT